MDQLLRESTRRVCATKSAKLRVLKKQASQLTFTQAKTFRIFNSIPIAIKGTFGDKRKRRDCMEVHATKPVRRRFWAATKAGTKPGILRRRCGAEEIAILKLGCLRWTYGTAVDTCRRDTDEDQAIKQESRL
jgi:hypothetical protein